MRNGKNIKGIIPAIITPFKKNLEIDLDAVQKVTAYVLKGGVHGVMPVGGTGEFPSLLREEKKDIVKAVADVAKGKVPIIAGTAACSTREVILLSNDAVEAGADAVIITAPYYFKLSESSLLDHYQTVARNIGCPLVVYNNPLYTGNNLTPEIIAHLLNSDNIVGVKQSNSDMGQLVELLRISPPGKSICTGIDSQFFPALCVGAVGIYSTAACVIPVHMVRLYNLYREGKYEQAKELHMKVQALNKYLEYDPGYVAPAKEALNLLGIVGGPSRPPLPELTDNQLASIKKALEAIRGI